MRKLVCCDIDGTLLDDNLNLSNKNKKSINKLYKDNIFFIVTGRFKAGVIDLLKEINLNIPFACFNGSYIEYDNKIIYKNLINKNLLQLIINEIKDYNTSPIIFTLNNWYCSKKDYWYDYQIKMCGFKGKICSLDNIVNSINPYKILIKDLDTDKIDYIITILKSKYDSLLSIVKSAPTQIEILPININKSIAIKKAEEYFKVDHTYTYAIGNYDNDIEMLEYAHTSIAMDNAPSYIKDICNLTTLSNNKDGVSYAIENFIL